MVTAAGSIIYEFDSFKLDANKRLLFGADGRPIPLKPKIFDTLLFLIENYGRVIEKGELMSAVWPNTIVEENNLNKNVSALRRALGENPSEHRFIATVPGKGYKFVAEVEEVQSRTDESAKQDRGAYGRSGKQYWLIAIAASILIGLGLVVYFAGRDVTNYDRIDSVAILPFLNVAGDPELDYFSEGLSDALIDRLSELPQLKVIARNSSSKYRDQNVDVKEVARNLGVQAIVTGRVFRKGDDLNIRVELIDARQNKQLWGEQFNRKVIDAIGLQSEIARTLSNKLSLQLTGEQEQYLTKRGTADPKAYDLLLKGDFANKKSATRGKALEYYEQAAAVDPNYALAHARLAATYQNLASGNVLDPKDVLPKVKAAVQRSIELDESLPDAHLVLANLARDGWDWKTADYEYQRALELNPNLSSARRRYSTFLSDVGRHDLAITQAHRVKELDPQNVLSHSALPLSLLLARQFDEAITESKKVLELDQIYGVHALLGHAYAGKGMFSEAITAYEEAIRLGSKEPYIKICLGAAFARAGNTETALSILKSFETGQEYISPGELAILLAALGDRDKTFSTLEKAYSAHDPQLQHLNADPGFDPLRDDPRFQDLIKRVGLPH